MNINEVCMKCMNGKLNEDRKCSNCGFTDSIDKEGSLHLPTRSILKGKYLIGTVIGEGGFGITYIGFDLDLEIRVAIKEFCPKQYVGREAKDGLTLYPYNEKDAEFFEEEKQKFINEARRLAKFRNEGGVVSVLDYFIENGTAYIVMDYIDGITLKKYLKTLHDTTGDYMNIDNVLKLFKPIMKTLDKIHKSNIIHRDISPDNIMLSENFSKIYLIDFGTARNIEDGHTLSEYSKSFYTPIEQLSNKMKQGPWTDVYALCATIYICITGRTLPESVSRLVEDDFISPIKLGIDISSQIESVLIKGLEVKPENRIQSVEELMNLLYEPILNPSTKEISNLVEENYITEKSNNDVKNEIIEDSIAIDSKPIESRKKSKKRRILFFTIISVFAFCLLLSFINILNKRNTKNYYSYKSITDTYYGDVHAKQRFTDDNLNQTKNLYSETLYNSSNEIIEERIRNGESITYTFYKEGTEGVFQKYYDSDSSSEELAWIFTLKDSNGDTLKEIIWNNNLPLDTIFSSSLDIPKMDSCISIQKDFVDNQIITDINNLTGRKISYEYEGNKVIEKEYDITSGTDLLTYKEYVNNELTVSYEYEEEGIKIDLINNIRIMPWYQKQTYLEKSAFVESFYTLDKDPINHIFYYRGITEEDIVVHCNADYSLNYVENNEDILFNNLEDRIVMYCNEIFNEKGYSSLVRTSEMDSYAQKASSIYINSNGNETAYNTGYKGKGKHIWLKTFNPLMMFKSLNFEQLLDYPISYKKIGVSLNRYNNDWLIMVAIYE